MVHVHGKRFKVRPLVARQAINYYYCYIYYRIRFVWKNGKNENNKTTNGSYQVTFQNSACKRRLRWGKTES